MIDIDGRPIGPGHPVWICAEIGVNHNGNIDLAMKLVNAAKRAGADCVKFQTFRTDRLLTPDSPQYRTLLPLELSYGQFRHLKQHADDIGITFLSTPDQAEDADFLDDLGVPAFKIGSGNLRNLPFLRHVAAKGKPIILSTGMADMGDVQAAARVIEGAGNCKLVLLHCTSIYPERVNDGREEQDPRPWNLRAIGTLKEFGYPVGYSDHSRAMLLIGAAVALGACVYEGHMYLDSPDGTDGPVSISPDSFARHVHAIRWLEAALGDGVKRPMPGEEKAREWSDSWKR